MTNSQYVTFVQLTWPEMRLSTLIKIVCAIALTLGT